MYYIIYTIYSCVCVQKFFLLCLIKSWERIATIKHDGDIGKHKLNEMGALNMKYNKMKQTR